MELEKNYYSLSEVRLIVFNNGVSISLLQNLIKKNEIPCERYGGRILVPRFWLVKKINEANNEK